VSRGNRYPTATRHEDKHGGAVIGAIGVSGRTVKNDHAVAEAGAAAVE
jgi:uncharacterized protein GlcG (DUF336 family)